MASVQVSDLYKSYAGISILKNINLKVEAGEFVVIVGPSGCGKSTLLRTIAGLENLNSGDIKIADKIVNDLSPAKRGIAMVFQSYALYPHMTVYNNMAFGLRVSQKNKQLIKEKIDRASAILQLDNYLDRYPAQLSGGQRQRVAIGRAIVRDPSVFLFDEPLSNLDAALRVQTRIELAKLHRDLSATIVYVTHDQVEAMTLASKIVVMNKGRVEQIGSPMALYHKPANIFVAGFIGSPAMNFMQLPVANASASKLNLSLPSGQTTEFAIADNNNNLGTEVTLGIRPEHLSETADFACKLTAQVEYVEHLGDVSYVYLNLSDKNPFILRTSGYSRYKMGDTAEISFDPQHAHLFDQSGKAISKTE